MIQEDDEKYDGEVIQEGNDVSLDVYEEKKRKTHIYNTYIDSVVKMIKEKKLLNVDEVSTMFELGDKRDPAWKAVFNSQAVKDAIERVRVELMIEMRNRMFDGKSYQEKLACLRLLCNDEDLARLNGGGIRLEDVKKLDRGAPSINVVTSGISFHQNIKTPKMNPKKLANAKKMLQDVMDNVRNADKPIGDDDYFVVDEESEVTDERLNE